MFEFCTKHKKIIIAVIIWLGLFSYLTAGLYTELILVQRKPLPDYLFEDYYWYREALFRTQQGQDPYAARDIGSGYLYPPPALLIVEAYSQIPTWQLQVSVYTVANIIFMLLMIYGIAYRYGYSISEVWWWFVIGLGFTPFVAVLHLGQINMITVFAIFLMFFWESSRPVCSGLCLSAAIITKVTPIGFLGYLLVNRNLKALAGAVIGVGVFCVAAGMRYGWGHFVTYIDVFEKLMHVFSGGINSQSLVAKLAYYHWIADVAKAQRILMCYMAVVCIVSVSLAFLLRKREPLFIIAGLVMTLSGNIVWYHHYVFLLLGLFVWMGYRRLRPVVTIWCLLGLFIIQIDVCSLTYGLLVHIFGHLSILAILSHQLYESYVLIHGKNLQNRAGQNNSVKERSR